ncbi:MAG: 4Fe-4S dicluster domain-containing protein [Gammaproteobacteria bacterium]|nr:4Fe-4S dicluster domain-containing protein [Gammaproteobacteria bacterium]MBU1655952.1 4Fe-4S dicluster domain-containing protein [Gammaproteobacteria bacterium]MBU1962464.1 4Fe-4S dicluster domain-containing protein [Gammaproteobacteria bacterium]
MEKILAKEKLRDWVASLQGCEVHGPAFADAVWNYAKAEGDIDLRHTNTVGSVKAFAFPQREVFFRFEHKRGERPSLVPTLPEPRPTVVFGVRPCDGRGMPRNDTVFSKEFKDPYYWARRDKLILVGLACIEPHSPNCFCQAAGGSPCSEEGLDILMTDLGDRYHVRGVTAKGIEVMERGRDAFKEASGGDQAAVAKAHEAACKEPQRTFGDLVAIPDAIRRNFEAPLWDEMARHCIGCGICTFLCPTCHCFDINDEVSSPGKGERVRTWDNCQFPDFTLHTSGHNPRDNLGMRLRQRVSHKFLYFVENHQTQQCTGCGRCISECPVGIDIAAVLERVSQS